MSSLKTTSAEVFADNPVSGPSTTYLKPRPSGDHSVSDHAVYCFSIRADLDSGLLSRLLEPLAKRGHWPSKFYSQAIATELPQQQPEAVVDIQLTGLDHASCDHIAMQFRGMVGVQSVLTSVRTSSD